ncbi:o-succinylbenzoate synthase [Leucobacter allii]|uniref:o-succinylbenzoate synthase n=1 Tax=Leucobacter allii TaxID=2932247 RepID=A0ABY4FMB8_9MICO|nr:o-succinylbenzoate synthase [Leucobacter allii]UOQ57409.1 o-succinylbenzoate synthase [Leucobacter allii]
MELRPAGSARPPLDAVLDAMRVVAIPTRTRFRGVTVREAALFDAPLGASEFSPFPEYGDAEAAAWLAAALDFGWREQPALRRERIAVNATVPAVPAAAVPGILARFPGCRTAKVKVAERGQTLAEDAARVGAVRAALGPDALIRIDANGGWTVAEALAALEALAPVGLDYAEQPCADVPGLAAVRLGLRARGIPVRIAADESVRKAEDPLAVARAGAADLLVVKAQPLGGIGRALGIVAEAGLPVVVSSALDTSVGIAMGLRLAAALPDGALAGACGLGTAALLAGDVVADPLLPVDGAIAVRRPALDPERLERHRARPEREAWWRERVRRAYARLPA